jgi:arsenite oxidase large subunit
MPDCLIVARIANHMERLLRERGKAKHADQFKGFDWTTEEDALNPSRAGWEPARAMSA